MCAPVAAQHAALQQPPVLQRDEHAAAAAAAAGAAAAGPCRRRRQRGGDHVRVGQHQPIRAQHKPGTRATRCRAALPRGRLCITSLVTPSRSTPEWSAARVLRRLGNSRASRRQQHRACVRWAARRAAPRAARTACSGPACSVRHAAIMARLQRELRVGRPRRRRRDGHVHDRGRGLGRGVRNEVRPKRDRRRRPRAGARARQQARARGRARRAPRRQPHALQTRRRAPCAVSRPTLDALLPGKSRVASYAREAMCLGESRGRQRTAPRAHVLRDARQPALQPLQRALAQRSAVPLHQPVPGHRGASAQPAGTGLQTPQAQAGLAGFPAGGGHQRCTHPWLAATPSTPPSVKMTNGWPCARTAAVTQRPRIKSPSRN